jgi:2-dehydro-3-deoxyphosphogluconate aldolase / (4S)-4-hydroxy-2-oxoglutarate aldolase
LELACPYLSGRRGICNLKFVICNLKGINMANFERHIVIQAIRRAGFVPVFSHPDSSVCKHVLDSCYTAGLRLFEFTNRGDFAHEIYAELHKYAHQKYPDMIMGAGTITDSPTAALFLQMGANFIVSPLLDEDSSKICNRRKVLWIPGCGSVTEISKGEELGADIIKIYPGGAVGGPGFVKAVKGPMPWTSLMPTSGVDLNEESFKAWFSAGIVAVGIGSQLFTYELITVNKQSELISKIRQLVEWVARYKQ